MKFWCDTCMVRDSDIELGNVKSLADEHRGHITAMYLQGEEQ